MDSFLKRLMSLAKSFFDFLWSVMPLSEKNALRDKALQPSSSQDNSTQTIPATIVQGCLARSPQLREGSMAGSEPSEHPSNEELISLLLEFNHLFMYYEFPPSISTQLDKIYRTYETALNDLSYTLDSLLMQGNADEPFDFECLNAIWAVFHSCDIVLHYVDYLSLGESVKWEYIHFADYTKIFNLHLRSPELFENNDLLSELLHSGMQLNRNVRNELSETRNKVIEIAIIIHAVTLRIWEIVGLVNELQSNRLAETPERLSQLTTSMIDTCLRYRIEEERLFFLKLAAWIQHTGI